MKMARSISPWLIVGLFVVVALFAMPLHLLAQGGAELICEPNKGTYGLQIYLKGNGFAPKSQVQIQAFGQTIAPQADNTGQFMVIAFAPTDETKFKPGTYTLTAQDAEGNAAEAVFELEVLTPVTRPTSAAAPSSPVPQPTPPPATSAPDSQPAVLATPTAIGATIAPSGTTEVGGLPNVVIIVIVAGVVGLLFLAVVIFFTLARRREPVCPPETAEPTPKPKSTTPPVTRQTATQQPAEKQVETPAEKPLTPGETTLVMPAVPKLSTRPTLQIIEGEGEGTVFSLEQKTTVIGRGEDCDIIVNHPMVSRHHAKVVRVGPSFYIHDLQSTNGTMVNGENIDQHVLQPEDEIQVGVTLLLFQQPNVE